MLVHILSIGSPTVNGNIYPKEVIEAALKNVKEPIFGGIERMEGILDISHQVKNLRIEGNTLVADVQVLATEKGQMLQEMLEKLGKDVSFTTCGVGQIVEENGEKTIADFELQSINAVVGAEPKPQLFSREIGMSSRKLSL